MADYRSVSQVKTYRDCPQRWYLERRLRAWQRPAAWLPQGTAVHAAAEAWERSERQMSLEDAQQVYSESYAEEIGKYAAITPNWNYWFSSGPYRGAVDVERRYGLGLAMVERYVDYYTEQHPEQVIWITPDGTPAIELEFNVKFGDVKVKGYIDQVTKTSDRGIVVRDIKSGNTPGNAFQLAVYARAVEQQYGQRIEVGDYWMGRAGGPTVPYDLSDWPESALADEFGEVDQLIKSEQFDPEPDDKKCMFCSVRTACPIFSEET